MSQRNLAWIASTVTLAMVVAAALTIPRLSGQSEAEPWPSQEDLSRHPTSELPIQGHHGWLWGLRRSLSISQATLRKSILTVRNPNTGKAIWYAETGWLGGAIRYQTPPTAAVIPPPAGQFPTADFWNQVRMWIVLPMPIPGMEGGPQRVKKIMLAEAHK